jgi:butyryl-CoA dehydrogenase/acyl-CoA dehydrogenase
MGDQDPQSAFLERARQFIADEIAPRAQDADEREEFTLSVFKEMGRLGFLGAPFPEEHGGGNLCWSFFYHRLVREVAAACASTATGLIAHTSLTAGSIARFGSKDQKGRYLKPLASGEAVGAFGLTEPAAGSDMAAIELSAEQRGDDYVLSGKKIYITNANVADLFVVAARTAPDRGAMGISLFIVEKGSRGLGTSGASEKKLGMRASDTGDLFFDEVVVPSGNLLGRKGLGLSVLHHTLTGSRVGMAAFALGIAESAYGHCLTHAREREQFGRPIYQFQSVGNMLADMATGICASQLLLERAAAAVERGRDASLDASIAKLFVSEMATKVTKDAIQIFGGYGYTRAYPLERLFRDAKLTEITDGTSELQRLLIAEEVIKKSAQARPSKA